MGFNCCIPKIMTQYSTKLYMSIVEKAEFRYLWVNSSNWGTDFVILNFNKVQITFKKDVEYVSLIYV